MSGRNVNPLGSTLKRTCRLTVSYSQRRQESAKPPYVKSISQNTRLQSGFYRSSVALPVNC